MKDTILSVVFIAPWVLFILVGLILMVCVEPAHAYCACPKCKRAPGPGAEFCRAALAGPEEEK